MKKTLFFLGLLLSVVFIYAQNGIINSTNAIDESANVLTNSFDHAVDASAERGTVILWDNTNINLASSGTISTYWSLSDTWSWCADDFDADGPWIIEKITTRGFANAPAVLPTQFAIVIFLNDAENCKPGEEIYRNTTIPGVPVSADSRTVEITLPEPFTLPSDGKYWIAIAGVYEASMPGGTLAEVRWNIYYGTSEVGCRYQLYDNADLFPPSNVWRDANSNSMYFMIEGIPNIPLDCDPVTNVTVAYEDCVKANLTWNAPGEGNFQYIIFRDGIEIDIVETTHYADVTFEPTLAHVWDIKVVCSGYTTMERVSLLACKTPDCTELPKSLSVNYTDDCEAKLKWYAPTDILWDNVRTTSSGYQSRRFMMDTYTHSSQADDFEVVLEPGEVWVITEVYVYGFYNSYEAPDFIGVEFWSNGSDNLPDKMLYEEPYLIPMSGSVSGINTILLPEPFIITESGRYWFSYYGTFEKAYLESRRFYVVAYAEGIGEPCAYWDEEAGIGWEPFINSTNLISLYFRIQGYKTEEPVLYNIYRDGLLIEANYSELEYIDDDFITHKPHRWAVTTVCRDGSGESAPIFLNMPNCSDAPDNVNENNSIAFSIFPNPSTKDITITAETTFKTVEVINYLGQTVLTLHNINDNHKNLDVSNLNNGIYFVRISFDNGVAVQKFVKQ